MRVKQLVILAAAIFSIFGIAYADMLPESGNTRVSLDIVLETDQDFPDYRFFLISGDRAREVLVKKGEKTNVSSIGGGARYSSGTIVAISAKTLAAYGKDPAGKEMQELEKAVAGGIPGAIELTTQSFSVEVPSSEAGKWHSPRFRLEHNSNGVNAVGIASDIDESKVQNNSGSNANNSSGPLETPAWPTIAAGILISLAVVVLGLWIILRFIRKEAA